MKKKKCALILLTPVVLIFASCVGLKTFKGTGDLHGSVYDVRNRPVAGCIILVEGKEKTLTDTNGRFVVSGLKSGSYTIETRCEYCESYSGDIKFLNETQYAVIRVVDNETLYELIEKALGKKDYEKADAYITRLIKSDAGNVNAIMYMALTRYLEGNKIAALEILNDAQDRGISDVWLESFKEKMEVEHEEG